MVQGKESILLFPNVLYVLNFTSPLIWNAIYRNELPYLGIYIEQVIYRNKLNEHIFLPNLEIVYFRNFLLLLTSLRF